MTNGIELIAAERKRQIKEEGWTSDHDDQHVPGALSGAAASYALSAAMVLLSGGEKRLDSPPPFFRFAAQWWKPKNPRADLIRAGALIAAELDRLERLNNE